MKNDNPIINFAGLGQQNDQGESKVMTAPVNISDGRLSDRDSGTPSMQPRM